MPRLIITNGDRPVDAIENIADFDLDDYLHRGRVRGYLLQAVRRFGGSEVRVATDDGSVYRRFPVTEGDLDGESGVFMATLNRALAQLESYEDLAADAA